MGCSDPQGPGHVTIPHDIVKGSSFETVLYADDINLQYVREKTQKLTKTS